MASGTITDPGATSPPTNYSELVMFDIFGAEAPTRFGIDRAATTAHVIGAMQTAANLSNAGIRSAGIRIRLGADGTASSGTNDAVSTKAIFVFQDPASLVIAKYQIPAPLASIFEADNISVDVTTSGTPVALWFTALALVAEYTNGTPIVPSLDVIRAHRYQRKGDTPRSGRVNRE